MKYFKNHRFIPLGLILFMAVALSALTYRVTQGQDSLSMQIVIQKVLDAGDILFTSPAKYATFYDDFFDFQVQASTTRWDSTMILGDRPGATTLAVIDSLSNGRLKFLTTVNKKGAGMNLQSTFAFAKLVVGSRPDSSTVGLTFESRINIGAPIAQTAFATGLYVSSGDSTSILKAQANGIYFYKYDESSTLYAKETVAVSTSDSASCGTVVANTSYRLKIIWNGQRASFYVNDIYKTTLTTVANQPRSLNLRPFFEFASGDSLVHAAYLDYVMVKQRR